MCSSILWIGIKKKRGGGNHQKLNRNKGASKTEALENWVAAWQAGRSTSCLKVILRQDQDKNPRILLPYQPVFISADTVFSSFTIWLRSCKPAEMLINSSYPLHISQTESRCLSMINQVAHWGKKKSMCFTWSFNLFWSKMAGFKPALKKKNVLLPVAAESRHS